MVLGEAHAGTAAVLEVRDPDDGSVVGAVPLASPGDVEDALARAVTGARTSKALPVHRRMAILHGAADRVAAAHESFAETIAREGIKTIREARAEVGRCVETLRLSAEEARCLNGETLPFDQRVGSEDKIGYWIRQPIGVIVAITPFNDPLNLVAHKVGPAIAGGSREGRRIAPTIVDRLPRESRLAREEIFGPVAGIIEVESIDEAIAVANDVDQALHACVFTRDIGAAMRVVREVEAGAVLVNESTDYRIDAMPFGGVKGSGLGREGVPFAAREMTTTKVVCLNV
jgi:acyl-CoA reductase-like NAD-dependent aldehyde dehydrogenase